MGLLGKTLTANGDARGALLDDDVAGGRGADVDQLGAVDAGVGRVADTAAGRVAGAVAAAVAAAGGCARAVLSALSGGSKNKERRTKAAVGAEEGSGAVAEAGGGVAGALQRALARAGVRGAVAADVEGAGDDQRVLLRALRRSESDAAETVSRTNETRTMGTLTPRTVMVTASS